MDTNIIIRGDCLEVLRNMPTASIDLIFADPPYWLRVGGTLKRVEGTDFAGCDDEWDNQFTSQEQYDLFTEAWLSECKRVLKKNGSLWVIGGMQCIYSIGAIMQKLGFWLINDIIWHKKNPTPNFLGTRLNNSHETLLWATLGEKSKFTFNYHTGKEINSDTVTTREYERGLRKQLGSVWRIAVCQGNERLKDDEGMKLHSTQKPEELLYRILAISSNVGDVILDPFAGTMTTAAVAKRMGRQYIMIERDQRYCDYGEQRLDKVEASIGYIEKALKDVKPPRADVKDMIQAGFFHAGEIFYLVGDPNTQAILLEDAKVRINDEVVDMHLGAAIAQKRAGRANGFNYWGVMRDGELVRISEIRELYRVEVLGYEGQDQEQLKLSLD